MNIREKAQIEGGILGVQGVEWDMREVRQCEKWVGWRKEGAR